MTNDKNNLPPALSSLFDRLLAVALTDKARRITGEDWGKRSAAAAKAIDTAARRWRSWTPEQGGVANLVLDIATAITEVEILENWARS